MKVARLLITVLALSITTQAVPTTSEEFLLVQDDTVTITVIEECCEDGGVLWWPFLFAGAVPFAFLDFDNERAAEIVVPPAGPVPTPTITQPVPEPSSLSLGLLTVIGILAWRKRR